MQDDKLKFEQELFNQAHQLLPLKRMDAAGFDSFLFLVSLVLSERLLFFV